MSVWTRLGNNAATIFLTHRLALHHDVVHMILSGTYLQCNLVVDLMLYVLHQGPGQGC